MTARRACVALATSLAIAGCFSPTTTTCADGTTCPVGTVCAPAGGQCVAPAQIAACTGMAEDANCTAGAIANGACEGGVCEATAWTATAILGGSAQATTVPVAFPRGVAVDRGGNVYAATESEQILRIDSSGAVTVVAGTGVGGAAGDGGLATSAELAEPSAIAVDGVGDVYIADTTNRKVRRVDATTGIITTFAGNGSPLFLGDNVPATRTGIGNPSGIALDGLGNLYIADPNDARVLRVDAVTGLLTIVAGTGSQGETGDGSSATAANLDPSGVAVDATGGLYIADRFDHVVRYVDAAGTITRFAGNGSAADAGDGGPATSASISDPFQVAIDAAGNVYIADSSPDEIRRVDPTGTITTIAGGQSSGFGGDGGPATAAALSNPDDVAVDERGDLYIADTDNNRIRRVDGATRTIATVAGNGGFDGFVGGAATRAQFTGPVGVAVDGNGNLYIADVNAHQVWIVSAAGVIEPFAGTGVEGFNGDGIPATTAELAFPRGVAVDASGNVYIADTENQRVRRVDTSGVITTVAGNGVGGSAGNGSSAVDANLDSPIAIAFDATGDLYILDGAQAWVQRVDGAGIITVVAGDGQLGGVGGDGGPATAAELGNPAGIAVDGSGNLYITDDENDVIRKVDAQGIISTFAGTGAGNSSTGDGGSAGAATLSAPTGIATDAAGNVYFADSGGGRVRRIDTADIISTVAGTGARDFGGLLEDGDGGSATAAAVNLPQCVAVDHAGTVYASDATRVRRISTSGVITTVAGPIDPAGMGPLAQAHFADPRALVVAPAFTLVAGGGTGTVQAMVPASSWLGVVAGRYPQATTIGARARFRNQDFGVASGVAFDAADDLVFVTESTGTGSDGNRVFAVTVTDPTDAIGWTIAALANAAGSAGSQDGAAATATFRDPTGLYFDPVRRVLYVADTGNHAIRAIDVSAGVANATVTTIAGTPETRGYFGDGGPATSALLFEPQAITACGNGDLFVADTGNNRVRRIAATGIISTVLGDGSLSSSGEGSPASSFPVDAPMNLACDAVGNLFATSTNTVRMVLADATGVVDGAGPVRTVYGLPGSPFPASVTHCLSGVAVVDARTVQVTDACTALLVELRRTP